MSHLELNILSAIQGMSAVWDVRYWEVSLYFHLNFHPYILSISVIFMPVYFRLSVIIFKLILFQSRQFTLIFHLALLYFSQRQKCDKSADIFSYSVNLWISVYCPNTENIVQKKLRIQALFRQCLLPVYFKCYISFNFILLDFVLRLISFQMTIVWLSLFKFFLKFTVAVNCYLLSIWPYYM